MNTLLILCLCFAVETSTLAKESPAVKILVIGRTGSGKSTLINNIFGRKIAVVGHRPFPETTRVTRHRADIHEVSVTACDTPGLGDASGKETDYVKEISVKCGDPDLVIFCLSMDNIRWQNDDISAIKTVTTQLGAAIWEHFVLVLTFGDKYIKTLPNKEQKQKEAFDERRSDLKTLFEKALLEVGVPSMSKGVRTAVSAKGVRHLPGTPNWLSELMVTCLSQTGERGNEGFRQILLGRIRNPNEDDFDKPEDEQPLVFTESLCMLMQL